MSQIESIRRFGFLLLIGLLALIGCGTPAEKATYDPDAGQHLANWMVADHVAAAKANIGECMECHGSDLSGGISGVACAECHLSGSPLTKTNCTSCHGLSAIVPYTSRHSGFPNTSCLLCHRVVPISAPRIDHSLSGRTNCLGCHDPPSSHDAWPNSTCTLCHHT